MIRLAAACFATAAITLALAVGLGVEVENALADEPQRPALMQARPISEALDRHGLPNLGVYKVKKGSR